MTQGAHVTYYTGEPVPPIGDTEELRKWSDKWNQREARFLSGLVLLLADSAPFAWRRDPDVGLVTPATANAWTILANSLDAGRQDELAELLREAGYRREADQVPQSATRGWYRRPVDGEEVWQP